MSHVNCFKHTIKYCEFLEAQDLAFICQYDLTIEVIFADQEQRSASEYWSQQMSTKSNISALFKQDFDQIKKIVDMKVPRNWPNVKAVRERSLAWLLYAAFERDMSLRGIGTRWFDVRIRITESLEHI